MHDSTKLFYLKAGTQYLKRIQAGVPRELFPFMKRLPRHSVVLDVGCAGGRDSKVLFKHGFRVVGIDIVPSFVRIAKREVKQATFKLMDVRRLHFPSNTFDAIWCGAVLHHLRRREVPGVLREFHKVLKSGGLLCVREKWGRGTAIKGDALWGGRTRRVTFFTVGELKGKLRRVGFTTVSSEIGTDALGRKSVKWVAVVAKRN